MKIAFIGQKAVPFYRDGGVERHVEDLATRLAKRGHEVTVYVRSRYVATKDDIWQGIHIVRVPSIPTKHLDTITYTFFATLKVVLPFVTRSQTHGDLVTKGFDIIHFHGVGPALLAWLPRIFTRAKIVVTFHSIDRFHTKWGAIARLILKFGEWTAVHIPHATIAVSRSIVKYCKKQYGKTIKYIPNGVKVQKIESSTNLQRFGLKKGRYIITVARLTRHKGIHYLIEAYKNIPDTLKSELKLAIVGAPSFTDDYETYLKELAKEDHRIIFTGYQTGDVLNELYANAYLYVHPSEAEGLSLSILEAMSFGKCVLISNIPENLEAIDHSGIPFEVSNTEDLCEKLMTLLNHPEIVEEKGKLALGFIKRYFEWDKIVNETEQLYRKLLP